MCLFNVSAGPAATFGSSGSMPAFGASVDGSAAPAFGSGSDGKPAAVRGFNFSAAASGGTTGFSFGSAGYLLCHCDLLFLCGVYYTIIIILMLLRGYLQNC